MHAHAINAHASAGNDTTPTTCFIIMDAFFQPGGGRAKSKGADKNGSKSAQQQPAGDKRKVPWVEK